MGRSNQVKAPAPNPVKRTHTGGLSTVGFPSVVRAGARRLP